MKKSLSLLVAIAMVFSMFAAVASAAEETKLTTEQKYEELVKAGLFEGYDDGEAHLDRDMTRAQASKIVALLTGYSEGVEVKDAGYTDLVGAGWATDYINYATQVGILEGKGNNKFDPSAKVTVQQLATIAVKLAKHADVTVPAGEEVEGKVDAWAAEAVASAIAAGLLAKQDDYTVNANRGLLVEVVFSAKEILAQAGAFAIAKVAQTDAREITVSFNKEVTDEQKTELTYELKKGTIPYTVTAKYADDKKSAVLTADFLPEGEYQLTVKGFDAVTVTIAKEVAQKIDIQATTLQRAVNQDPQAKLLNQFNKEIKNAGLNVTVYNASKGQAVSATNGKYDLTGGTVPGVTPAKFAFDVDDNVVVTVTHSSGLSASKNYKLVAGSSATAIKIGTVQPLKDKSRISAGDSGLVLPIELLDQYGNAITLGKKDRVTVANNVVHFEESGITFLLSQAGIISGYAIDDKGVLTFDVATAGTLVIHASNVATGASASVTVKVEGAPVLKTLSMEQPGVFVAANEEVKIPYTAVDNFGDAIKAKDIKINRTGNFEVDQVQFNSNVPFATGYPKFNGKGELMFKFNSSINTASTAFISAYINGQPAGQLQFQVSPEATKTKINGVKNLLTTLASGVSVKISKDNVTALDNYGRTNTVANLVQSGNAGDVVITKITQPVAPAVATSADLDVDGDGNLVIKAHASVTGVTEFKIEIKGTDDSSYTLRVNVVKPSDVKTYSIKSIGTVYAGKVDNAAQDATSKYAKTVELVGKIGSTEVAIDQTTAFDFVSQESTNNALGVLGKKIFGLAEGSAVVAVYKDSVKLAETTVTTSTAAPVATKVEFGKGEYVVDENTDSVTFAVNPAAGNTPDVKITVKDQYGVEVGISGLLSSSDSKVATVDTTNGTVNRVAGQSGQVTLTYMTTNSVVGTAVIVFE